MCSKKTSHTFEIVTYFAPKGKLISIMSSFHYKCTTALTKALFHKQDAKSNTFNLKVPNCFLITGFTPPHLCSTSTQNDQTKYVYYKYSKTLT